MEHSQELAEQIRVRIRELETDLEAHRRALAVLEQPADGELITNGKRPRRSRTAEPEASDGVGDHGAGDGPVSAPKPAAPMAAAPKATRSRRQAVSTEAVFDALQDGNDQAAVIAKEFGVSTAAVRLRLEQLEQAGRVSRSGERRGTRWRGNASG